MTAQGYTGMDRGTAERLLAGRTTVRGHAVGTVLTAARAPARPGPLPGEDAAVAAFRAAYSRGHLTSAQPAGRQSMIKLLTLKVAIGTAAVVAAGGAAFAASGGALPNPLAERPAPQASASANSHSQASPSPSLKGLCRAYRAKVSDDPGRALDSPAFQALVRAAGGTGKVADYCADLLGDDKRSRAGDHTGDGGDGRPTRGPRPRPNGGPGDHPTGGPATRPGR